MQAPQSEPCLIKKSDPIRDGLSALQNPLDRALPVHAVETIQRDYPVNKALTNYDLISRTYGQHAALALRREQAALSQFRRGPGMQSSMIGLEISMGTHNKIDFCDYMGGPSRSERSFDFHAAMEKRMDALSY